MIKLEIYSISLIEISEDIGKHKTVSHFKVEFSICILSNSSLNISKLLNKG